MNTPIKILYIQTPGGGGSLFGLYEMLRQLDLNEVQPVVLSYYKNHYTEILETVKGVKVIYVEDENLLNPKKKFKSSGLSFLNVLLLQYYSFKKHFFYDKSLVQFIYKIIINENPQLVTHFNDLIDNRPVRACIKAGIPQVVYNHTLGSYGRNYMQYFIDYFFMVKHVRMHIHMTEAVKIHFAKLYNLKERDSCLFHDYVDTIKFKPTASDQSFKNEFSIAGDDFVITDIGRIIRWKGQHVLIEAINLIKDKIPRIKVLIVGPYDEAVGSFEYYNYLQKLTQKYSLQHMIIFTGNREDVATIMNNSNIIVHTSVKPEPQGIVLLEALLCRKPVIATNAGGAVEIIKKYGGILVQPSDAEMLSRVLLHLILKKNQMDTGEHYPDNYEKLINDLDPENKTQQLMNIYKSVLN